MRFVKGHGTENDFVLLPDLEDQLELTAELVRAVCDRRAGVGADGVLRVVRADGQWFMDYRNADGSIAEMCGNGVRVFARYLVDTDLVEPGEFTIGTRAGPRTVQAPESGDITVDMGPPELLDTRSTVDGLPGRSVSMGNPHVVVVLPDETALTALDLTRVPTVEPGLPGGQNVEFIVRRGARALTLRVHERGVGETRSCGTGVCAAVVAAIAGSGSPEDQGAGRDEDWSVRVPGGELTVRWADSVLLRGPAVLVAGGEIDLAALA
jgi:diaminopimelate epimerase